MLGFFTAFLLFSGSSDTSMTGGTVFAKLYEKGDCKTLVVVNVATIVEVRQSWTWKNSTVFKSGNGKNYYVCETFESLLKRVENKKPSN